MTAKDASWSVGVIGLALAAVALLTSAGSAANGNPGREAFFRYCSSCHGDDGRGNGPAASAMQPRPADLTQIAKRNGGIFPYDKVKEIIDGRTRVVAHGSSQMPVWGKIFAGEETLVPPATHAVSQINLIATYLSSIQTN
jgi:mono/diheme cytochrome c family protein